MPGCTDARGKPSGLVAGQAERRGGAPDGHLELAGERGHVELELLLLIEAHQVDVHQVRDLQRMTLCQGLEDGAGGAGRTTQARFLVQGNQKGHIPPQEVSHQVTE